jgi:hypothetical protein
VNRRLGLVLVLATTQLACAAKSGWTRGDRVCEASDPPRICFDADPDAPLSLSVADLRLTPGECAFAPDGARGGSIRVAVEDGETGRVDHRRVWVRRAATTHVTVDDHDTRIDRSRCTRER